MKYKEGTKVNIKHRFAPASGHTGIIERIEEKSYIQYWIKIDGEDVSYPYSESEIEAESMLDEHIEEYEESNFTIDDYFSEMATVKGGFMSIKIAIYGSEGKYPHFHFYKDIAPERAISKEKRGGGGCICIDSANYFIHGAHTDTMDRKEIDGLIKFLKSPNKSFQKYTNWEYIVALWNDNNPDQKQLPIDLPIPDYKHNMGSIQERL